MAPANRTLLSRLFRRLIISGASSIIGAWGLFIPRLSLFKKYCPYEIPIEISFYIDIAAFSLALLGLFLFIYYIRVLGWRLRRLDDLGEANW
jgi:hypothetical protein